MRPRAAGLPRRRRRRRSARRARPRPGDIRRGHREARSDEGEPAEKVEGTKLQQDHADDAHGDAREPRDGGRDPAGDLVDHPPANHPQADGGAGEHDDRRGERVGQASLVRVLLVHRARHEGHGFQAEVDVPLDDRGEVFGRDHERGDRGGRPGARLNGASPGQRPGDAVDYQDGDGENREGHADAVVRQRHLAHGGREGDEGGADDQLRDLPRVRPVGRDQSNAVRERLRGAAPPPLASGRERDALVEGPEGGDEGRTAARVGCGGVERSSGECRETGVTRALALPDLGPSHLPVGFFVHDDSMQDARVGDEAAVVVDFQRQMVEHLVLKHPWVAVELQDPRPARVGGDTAGCGVAHSQLVGLLGTPRGGRGMGG